MVSEFLRLVHTGHTKDFKYTEKKRKIIKCPEKFFDGYMALEFLKPYIFCRHGITNNLLNFTFVHLVHHPEYRLFLKTYV